MTDDDEGLSCTAIQSDDETAETGEPVETVTDVINDAMMAMVDLRERLQQQHEDEADEVDDREDLRAAGGRAPGDAAVEQRAAEVLSRHDEGDDPEGQGEDAVG